MHDTQQLEDPKRKNKTDAESQQEATDWNITATPPRTQLGIEVSECSPFGFSNVIAGNLVLSPRFIYSSHFFHRDSAVAECVLAVDDECVVC
jgi:hypothetical protein